jgi:hypothetical protein
LHAQVSGNGFGSRANVEFLVNMMQMGTDGQDADVEFRGDLFVAMSLRQQSQDYFLTRGQVVEAVLLFDPALEGFNYEAGDGVRLGEPPAQTSVMASRSLAGGKGFTRYRHLQG